ncbi:MAG: complex I subunit 4 family protein [Phycisphaeraceae bacterium]
MWEAKLIPILMVLPLVSALSLIPPIRALDRRNMVWSISLGTSLFSFLVSVFLAIRFWMAGTPESFEGTIEWLPALGLSFSYGLNSISLWLILLTTFLMPIVVLASLIEVTHDYRQFHFWLQVLEAALIGTFISRDLVLFYVCFEFTLIPLYFLIGLFGHHERYRAATMLFLYTFAASLFTLAAAIYVAWHHYDATGVWSFKLVDLYSTAGGMSFTEQCWVFAGFLAGFGVKMPLWPVHTWLPLAHTEAPTAGSVDLAGLVLKLGPYGLLVLAFPMAPQAAIAFAPWIGVVAVIGILYAALCCWVQRDAKKLVAYSSVSHMGFCALGLFAFDAQAIGAVGAVAYMINHGLATGALFLCLGMLYDRFHTRELDAMSGLIKIMPIWGGFMIFFVLASVGLPGLNGFVGEFLTLMGTFASGGTLGIAYAAAGAGGLILGAIYLLYMLGKMVWGPLKLPSWHESPEHGIARVHRHDLSWREVGVLAPIAVVCLFLGIYPAPMLDSLEGPVTRYIEQPMLVLEEKMRQQDQEVQTVEVQSGPTQEPLSDAAPPRRRPSEARALNVQKAAQAAPRVTTDASIAIPVGVAGEVLRD